MWLRIWRAISPVLILLGGVSVQAVALAQPGYYVTPSFGIAELYNDNIFYTPSNRKGDFITRLSPGILAGYESATLTLLGGYTFDGEIFAHRTDLNEAMARQKASIDFRALPTRPLTLSVKGEYTETQTPRELNLATGIPLGRTRADQFLLDPSVAYRFDAMTTGTLGYKFTKDDLTGGITSDTHVGKLGIDRRVTPSDTLGLEYSFQQFLFDGEDRTNAYSIVPGWTHELTPLTSLTLRAGPRFSEGSVDADILASVRHRLTAGEVSLVYTRTQTTALGLRGTTKTDSVALVAKYKPLPLLELSLSPGFFRSRLGDTEADVYRVKLDATYELTRWLSLLGSYEYVLQDGILTGTPGVVGQHRNISNNTVTLGLVAKFRTRVY